MRASVLCVAGMSFEVPPHVRPIREKVRRFVEERIYHGAKGLTPDTPLERMYRHARFGRIYDGPDEAHRATVARLLLRTYERGGRVDFGGGSLRVHARPPGGGE